MEYRKKFDMSVWPTIFLIMILELGFGIGAWGIRKIGIENSLNSLEDAASQFALTIERTIESDREQLEIMADVLAKYEDISSEEARNSIVGIEPRGEQSAIHILTADNRVFAFENGTCEEKKAVLRFEEEKEKGSYLSEVMISEDGTQRYLYHAVPIQKDGTIKGILYGIYDLSTFSDALLLEFFGGKARLYILEGRQGEFIVSSWNNNKNIYSESLGEQKIKRGHDYNQWIDSLKNGREDHMVAFSEASGEYFYTYAKPVGVNNWMVMISAPESAVFERVVHVHHILIMLAILDLVLLFAYFIWLIAQVHSEVKRNERQIKNMSYMYDVQKTLFNSHQCEESMMEALEKTGRMLTASNVFLCVVGNKKITKIYQWAEDTEKEETTREAHIREVLGAVKNRLATGDSLLIDRRNEKTEIVELRFEAMKQLDISSLMLVPLQNTEGKLIGVLGTMNMKRHWGSAELLEGPAWNFMMALNNIASYRFIQKMGTMDSVTGLKNRNSYEQDLDNYAECAAKAGEKFCCIYMDANGLHELNNVAGHAAGDAMLRYIGEAIAELFGEEKSYRIGGDEFVIFCRDNSKEEIKEKISQFEEIMLEKKYYVSVGHVWNEGNRGLPQMILEAEQKMYAEKQRYYEERGEVDRIRNRYRVAAGLEV